MSIKKVMVVGSGQMGAGIAQVFAKSGLEVYLNDISEEIVMSNLGKIDKQLEGQVKKERLTAEENKLSWFVFNHQRLMNQPKKLI